MKKSKLRGALIRALGGYETQTSMPDLGPLFQSPVLSSSETLKFRKIQAKAAVRGLGEMRPEDLIPVAQAQATENLLEHFERIESAISFRNEFDYEAQTCEVTATLFIGYKEVDPDA